MCQNRPGEFEPLVSLGDALIRVNRTEEGIKSYEAALRLRKSDISLQNKIGRAMVITHDYSRGFEFVLKNIFDQNIDTFLFPNPQIVALLNITENQLQLGKAVH